LANQLGGITPDIDQPTLAPFLAATCQWAATGKVLDKMLGGHGSSPFATGPCWLDFLAEIIEVPASQPAASEHRRCVVGTASRPASHLVMDYLCKEGVPWFAAIPSIWATAYQGTVTTDGMERSLFVVIWALISGTAAPVCQVTRRLHRKSSEALAVPAGSW